MCLVLCMCVSSVVCGYGWGSVRCCMFVFVIYVYVSMCVGGWMCLVLCMCMCIGWGSKMAAMKSDTIFKS